MNSSKKKRLIHQLYGQKSEGLSAKQTHLNQEAAQEDLSALEQIRDDYHNDLSQEALAKLPAVERIETETLIGESELNLRTQTADEALQAAPVKAKKPKRPKYLTTLRLKPWFTSR